MTYLYNRNTIVTNSFLFFRTIYETGNKVKKREWDRIGKGSRTVTSKSIKDHCFNGSARKVLFSMLLTINWVGLGSWNLVGARHMLCRAGELRLYILFHGCVLQTGWSTGQTCDWVLGDSRCNYGRCGHTQTHINTSVIRAGKRRNCHTSSTLEVLETTLRQLESVNTVRMFTNHKPISYELQTSATVKGVRFLIIRAILE